MGWQHLRKREKSRKASTLIALAPLPTRLLWDTGDPFFQQRGQAQQFNSTSK